MKRFVVNSTLAAIASVITATAGAQTCQVIGQMIYCQPAAQPDFSYLGKGRGVDITDAMTQAAQLRLVQQQVELQRLAGLAFIFESVALATDLHDVSVMQKAIKKRCGQCLVIGESTGPLCERQIAGEDDAAALVSFRHHVE